MTQRWAHGTCWRCDAPDTLVLWLGPVQTIYGAAGFWVCELCIRRLETYVMDALTVGDQSRYDKRRR